MRPRMRTFLFLVLAFIAVVPAAVFGLWPHTNVLEKEIAEVSRRNLLVARNMSLSLSHYERNIRSLFQFFSKASVSGNDAFGGTDSLDTFHFRHICISHLDDPRVIFNALSHHVSCPGEFSRPRFEFFKRRARDGEVAYTPVMEGPGGQPAIYLVMRLNGYLAVGAVDTGFLVDLARSVVFGKRGHAAVVDHTGRVIAHPNPNWVEERKDISKVGPVKLMMAGETGVSRFFSPAANMDMVAGYTVVPFSGWGIMVPIPTRELDDKIFDTKLLALGVLLLGLLIASVLAWWLAGVTSRPLTAVARAARSMTGGARGVRVPEPGGLRLREPSELAHAFNAMADSVETAMAAEREAHADSDAIVGASPAAIFLLDEACRFRLVNKRFEEWFQRPRDEVEGRTPHDVFPADLADRLETTAKALSTAGKPRELEVKTKLRDGTSRDFRAHMFPIFGTDGAVHGAGAILVDKTEKKSVEETLRRVQKMEAVGQLTGGVAHDFNNLLAITKGHGELLRADLDESNPHIAAILRAAKRGGALTQRMLAFSRRQPLRPEPIDIAEMLEEMSDLLDTSVGETIETSYEFAPDRWLAKADPVQLENAILNLAFNARDAMANGGRLCFEARNFVIDHEFLASNPETTMGDYVMLTVSDTGHGMSPEVLERAFEPFFTTKDIGAGSGLGLSTVYGFVKQSGGHV